MNLVPAPQSYQKVFGNQLNNFSTDFFKETGYVNKVIVKKNRLFFQLLEG